MASGGTGTYGFPYPLQTDPVDVASDVQDLAEAIDAQFVLTAPLLSPTFTGVPLSVTPSNSDNSTKIATTAFVKNQGYLTAATATSTYAPLVSPTFTGTPVAPTASLGTDTTQIATTEYVQNELAAFVTLPSQTGASGKFLKSNGTVASWETIVEADVSGLAATISGLSSIYAPLTITINSQVSTYTLVMGDMGKQVELVVGSANFLYIPTDASVNFPIGTTISVAQMGAGQTTIAATSPGTTTVSATPGLKLRAQFSTAVLVKRAPNNWLVSGDLVA